MDKKTKKEGKSLPFNGINRFWHFGKLLYVSDQEQQKLYIKHKFCKNPASVMILQHSQLNTWAC